MEDVSESPCKKHSVAVERESVEKLLEIDEKLFQELSSGWGSVGSGEIRNTPLTTNPSATKLAKPRHSVTSATANDIMKLEITGWVPDKLVLRKPAKEKQPKPMAVVNSSSCNLKDSKFQMGNEQLYMFKHYKSIRKYIEEYRRQHSSIAKHLSDYLATNLRRNIYQIRTSHNTGIQYRSHSRGDNYSLTAASRLSDHANPNGQVPSPNYEARDDSPTSGWTVAPPARHSKMTKKNDAGSNSNSTASLHQQHIIDPSIIFKYKLAPNYVQSLLQQHHHLGLQQKASENGTSRNGNKNGVDKNNNADSSSQSETQNPHVPITTVKYGEELHTNESRVKGIVTPVESRSKSGQISAEGSSHSAKQTIRSRSSGTVNLALTKVTLSPLPSVTVISRAKIQPSPLSGLEHENEAAEKKTKIISEQSSSLPGGGRKTLDNLNSLVGKEKQDDLGSVKSEAISLSNLSTTCLGEEQLVSHELCAAEQSFSFLLKVGLLQNHLGSLVIPKTQVGESVGLADDADFAGNHRGPSPKEKVSYPPAGRPPKPKGKRLVKYMTQEGGIRSASDESKGHNSCVNGGENLASQYQAVGCSSLKDKSKIKHNRSASDVGKSDHLKMLSDNFIERLVKSAMDVTDVEMCNRKNVQLKTAADKRSKRARSQPKLEPPTLPFFKFWGGSLPPEARSHAKKQSASREGSSKSSHNDAENLRLSASSKRSQRQAKSKTGPAIASGMWFDSTGRAYVSLATRYDPVRK